MVDLTRQCLDALHAGRACLHPTDTLPGLTFDPAQPAGRDAVARIKGRPEAKGYLALVASLATAQQFFRPLPGPWDSLLAAVWPGPLSVVWEAAAGAPPVLVAADGTIGLRVPRLPAAAAWFGAVLAAAPLPLPTTSVNRSGEPPATRFAAAARMLLPETGVYLPDWPGLDAPASAPSTLIRIHADATFTVLRHGAQSVAPLAAHARQVG